MTAVTSDPGEACIRSGSHRNSYISRGKVTLSGTFDLTANGSAIYSYAGDITVSGRLTAVSHGNTAIYSQGITGISNGGLTGTITIVKDRHIFRYQDLTYELDVYDFWEDQATLEAEVDSEDTPIPLPPCVELIREVTDDRSYSNSSLARRYGAEQE